jgi:uncharacterized membrane protein YphA (DoxX/SURF4 family)
MPHQRANIHPRKTQCLLLTFRLFIGGLFVWSAIGKAIDYRYFFLTARQFQLVPDQILPFFCWCVIGVECVCGAALCFGLNTRVQAMILGMLTLLFVVALSVAFSRGESFECGCFGPGDGERISLTTIGRDLLILAGCLLLSRDPIGRRPVDCLRPSGEEQMRQTEPRDRTLLRPREDDGSYFL